MPADRSPTSLSAAPLVSCTNLTKRFDDGPPAVRDLSFDVAPGSITGFIGANGAGKSTTLRMLVGLVHPSSGDAHIAGRPYRDLDQPRRHVGAVLDGPGAHPAHRARTHLRIIAAGAGLPAGRTDEVIDLVGLHKHRHRKIGTYSLGMRQRLALAGALLGDPPVLLLDEPVNGLDPSGIHWLRGFLRHLADEGRAVLVSSHLLSELAEIADRIMIIDRGRLVADGALDDLVAGRSLEEVYFEVASRSGDEAEGVSAPRQIAR